MRSATLPLLLVLAMASQAQTAYFDEPTDTIQISDPTTVSAASTYEAVVLFPGEGGVGGMIYNEWTGGAEDKLLQFYFSATGPSTLVGFNFPGPGVLTAEADAPADTWHHVAFVYDGMEERLYLNGQRVAGRPRSGAIGNGSGRGHVGGVWRDGTVLNSIRGHLDSFRISSVARYTGDSFAPPLGDLASDDDTVLLFTFNEPAGSKTIQDDGPSDLTGTLGAGFTGATPPTLGGMPVADEETPNGALALSLAPNPARGRLGVRFSVTEPGPVRLAVHDALGREVAVLADGPRQPGEHEVNVRLAGLPAGIYLARLRTEAGTIVRALTVTR